MIKLIKNLTKKDYIYALISFVLIIAQVWLELKMPDYMSKVTILVESDGSEMSEILLNGLYMMLCAFGSLISTIIVGYLIANVSASFSLNTRKQLFEKVENLGVAEVKQFEVSSLITRTTNDITQIEMLIAMGLQLLIKSPVTAIWAITKILNKNFNWSMATLLAVIILLTTITILTIIVVPKFKILQKLTDKLNNVTRENLKGIRVVRAFNAEKYQEDKFNETNTKLTNQQLFNQRMFSIMQPVMYLTLHTLTLSIYFIGALLIKDSILSGKITLFGDMVVFSSYAMQVIMSFLMLAVIFMMLPRASVSAKRINEVLDEKITIKDGTVKTSKEEGTVEFKNVSFKYPDAEEYLLENISFKINKGDTVAFIGSTGSGKSTLINLIPRFYDVTDGEILVDNINVKDYKLESLYNKIGYVSQKAVMFDGSVKDNVSYGENGKGKKSEELIKKAIEVAQGKDFVEKLDDKYDSHIAQGGTNISGGQKQRLSIARAIAREPEIYIFDDSFSALDYKTDALLRKSLKKYTKDATILIVAQRIGTIMNADKIVVLDEGKCVGMGTHKELLKSCEVYKQIALSQITEEELENA
ncbi:MAG: ABC transporter ATP-binding protein [Bacilli bacterium]|nr:ABC transporter ATP-binding protein [Bacilli bacterium]MBO6194935.1 ABC transporter ATP-binding protein [Bacilli bacterium]